MKKILILSLSLLTLALTGCSDKSDGFDLTNHYEKIEESKDPNSLDGKKFFHEDDMTFGYKYAGFYEKDGSVYELKDENPVTGKTINVALYGADNTGKTDSTAAVKAAMDSAKSGDEVYFPKGTYYFSSYAISNPLYSHISLKEGVNLRGENKDETFLVSDHDEDNNLEFKTSTIFTMDSNSVISGLTLTAEVPESDMPGMSTTTNNPNGNRHVPTHSIYVTNFTGEQTTNVVVRDMNIEYFKYAAVTFQKTIGCTVKDTLISNATDIGGGGSGYGVHIRGNGWEAFPQVGTNDDSRFNLVDNVTVTGPYIRHGIILSYVSHNNLIKNCTVDGSQDEAFDYHGNDEFLNVLVNNTAINTNAPGFGFGNPGSTHDATGPGNVVYKNTVKDSKHGFNVILGTKHTFFVENKIENLYDGGIGFYLQNADNTIIDGNKIENNNNKSNVIGLNVQYEYVWFDPALGLSTIIVNNNTFSNLNTGLNLLEYNTNSIFSNNTYDNVTTEVIDTNAEFVLPPKSTYFDKVEGTVINPIQEAMINRGNYTSNITNSGYFYFKGSNTEPGFNRVIFHEWDLTSQLSQIKSDSEIYLRICYTSNHGLQELTVNGIGNVNWNQETINWGNAPFINNITNNSELPEDPTGKYPTDVYPYGAQIYDPNNLSTKIDTVRSPGQSTEYLAYYINVTDYVLSMVNSNTPIFTFMYTQESLNGAYSSMRNMIANSAIDTHPALIIKQ